MSPELSSSIYADSELWQARDLLLLRKALAAAEAGWNDVLASSAPSNGAILQLQSAAANLQAVAAELQFMRSSR